MTATTDPLYRLTLDQQQAIRDADWVWLEMPDGNRQLLHGLDALRQFYGPDGFQADGDPPADPPPPRTEFSIRVADNAQAEEVRAAVKAIKGTDPAMEDVDEPNRTVAASLDSIASELTVIVQGVADARGRWTCLAASRPEVAAAVGPLVSAALSPHLRGLADLCLALQAILDGLDSAASLPLVPPSATPTIH